MATSDAEGGFKRFSGAGANGRDLVSVETDHNDNAHERGQRTVCVLNVGWRRTDGLEFAEFAIDGGEYLIFNILEARYPDKDPMDRANKALFDVFEVSAREGERLSSRCFTIVREMQKSRFPTW